MAGLVVAVVLLQFKLLPLSFADDPEAHEQQAHDQPLADTAVTPMTEDEQELYLAYPHARREMGKELLFLAFPVAGFIAGAWLWRWIEASHPLNPPDWAQAVGGVLLGYLVGAAVVWGTRVLGTLMFGREAMGLGDVHLLAAVGAVLGAKEVAVLFFIAPFFGLLYAMLAAMLGKITRWKWRMIPYGPFLAAAAVVMMLLRSPILRYLGLW
jgi:leader peptidase (prepilin peptidase)/N-methyltransferase